MQTTNTTITTPDGNTRPITLGHAWQSLTYLDPFQLAHGAWYTLARTAHNLRTVA